MQQKRRSYSIQIPSLWEPWGLRRPKGIKGCSPLYISTWYPLYDPLLWRRRWPSACRGFHQASTTRCTLCMRWYHVRTAVSCIPAEQHCHQLASAGTATGCMTSLVPQRINFFLWVFWTKTKWKKSQQICSISDVRVLLNVMQGTQCVRAPRCRWINNLRVYLSYFWTSVHGRYIMVSDPAVFPAIKFNFCHMMVWLGAKPHRAATLHSAAFTLCLTEYSAPRAGLKSSFCYYRNSCRGKSAAQPGRHCY